MPVRAWAFCLGLIALLFLAVVGLDAWQTWQGETSLFGLRWGRTSTPSKPAQETRAIDATAGTGRIPNSEAVRAPASPAQSSGGRFGRGAEPPSEGSAGGRFGREAEPPSEGAEPGVARLAVVIDGFGTRQDLYEQAASLDRPLTIAVLPDLPLSERIGRDAARAGFEVLVQVPLEPYRHPEMDPGPGAALLSMNRDEVIALASRHLAAMPAAVGVIGHMGSRFTEDREHMRALLEPVRARGLIFVDAMVSNLSVAGDSAQALGIRSVRRQVRVDAAAGEGAARRHIEEAGRVAERRGEAVVLVGGHPLTIRLLKEYIPRWEERGIRLVPVSGLAR